MQSTSQEYYDFDEISVPNGWTFSIDEGFPSIGFLNAKFQLKTGGDNKKYSWYSDAPWVEVNNEGIISFIKEPMSLDTVTITAICVDSGDVYNYSFQLHTWVSFINSYEEGIESIQDGQCSAFQLDKFKKLVETKGYDIASEKLIYSTNNELYGSVGTLIGEWGGIFTIQNLRVLFFVTEDTFLDCTLRCRLVSLCGDKDKLGLVTLNNLPEKFGIIIAKSLNALIPTWCNYYYSDLDITPFINVSYLHQTLMFRTPQSVNSYIWSVSDDSVIINDVGAIIFTKKSINTSITVKAKKEGSPLPPHRFTFSVNNWGGIGYLKIPSNDDVQQTKNQAIQSGVSLWDEFFVEKTNILFIPDKFFCSGINSMVIPKPNNISIYNSLSQEVKIRAHLNFVGY